jgi:hypothetical protein
MEFSFSFMLKSGFFLLVKVIECPCGKKSSNVVVA